MTSTRIDTRTQEEKDTADQKFRLLKEDIARSKNPKLAAIDQLKEDIESYKFHMKLKDLGEVSKKTNQEIIKTLSDRIKANKKLLGL